MQLDLPLIWGMLLSFVIIVYVILDGFDLGIGILFPLAKTDAQRDVMMNTVIPVWDGNETWLVLGAAFLYGAFPLAYSILLPTLYIPICIMLAALIFRGVAFEFRHRANSSRIVWDIAFASGSTLAAFCQGLALGTFVMGYHYNATHATIFHWLTPFSMMTGIAVVFGYALLGATWLIRKTVGELQLLMFKLAKIALMGVAFFMIVVSVWTPFAVPEIWQRWFNYPRMIYLAPLPLLTGLAILLGFRHLQQRHDNLPFYFAISLFIFAYVGFCVSDFPYIVPRSITLWQAASPDSSLRFLLVGTVLLLPVLLIYTGHAYQVFKGKVEHAEHHYG